MSTTVTSTQYLVESAEPEPEPENENEVIELSELNASTGASSQHQHQHQRTAASSNNEENLNPEDNHEFDSLPQADTGKDAWLFLAGAFMIEALVWGFPFSFGTFQSYYSTNPLFADSGGIAAIGTTCSGIMYLSAPITAYFLTKFPIIRQRAATIGLAICVISLLGASWATTVPHLILTQGVIYAIGGSLLYTPVILYVDEWFIRRKGLAYGVMWAGTGASGLILPLVMSVSLSRYGFRTVHRASAVAIMVLSAPLLHYVRARVPVSSNTNTNTTTTTTTTTEEGQQQQQQQQRQNKKKKKKKNISTIFLTNRTFWLIQTGNIIQGLGFFLPSIYLPLYAESLHLSATSGSALVSILNASSVLGQIFLGALSDRVHISRVIVVSMVGATLSVFFAWGFASSLPVLVVFAMLYGFFAGGFTSTYAGTCREVTEMYPGGLVDSATVFGMLAAGRGVGNVVCGPISEQLLKAGPVGGIKVGGGRGGAYGTRFGGLVLVTGVTALLGGLGGFAKERKREEREE